MPHNSVDNNAYLYLKFFRQEKPGFPFYIFQFQLLQLQHRAYHYYLRSPVYILSIKSTFLSKHGSFSSREIDQCKTKKVYQAENRIVVYLTVGEGRPGCHCKLPVEAELPGYQRIGW